MNPSVCLNIAEDKTQELADSPYVVGLDPPTVTTLSPLLYRLAQNHSPRLVLALRQQDPLPEWITHLIYLGPSLRIAGQGVKADVLQDLDEEIEEVAALDDILRPSHLPRTMNEVGRKLTPTGIHTLGLDSIAEYEELTEEQIAKLKTISVTRARYRTAKADYESGGRGYRIFKHLGLDVPIDAYRSRYSIEGFRTKDHEVAVIGEPLVEMSGVSVKYGDKQVLGDWTQIIDGQPKNGMWWQIRRGQRWGVFGPNGRLPSLGISTNFILKFSRLIFHRVWKNNVTVTHVLGSSADILSPHKTLWPVTTTEPRSARNIDF